MSQKVLVVDDDERFGESLADMLRFLDFDPTVCTTAQQGLNLIRNCEFRLVFSDIRMPGINGFEFHRFLATINQSLAKRFIFLTGDIRNPETRHMIEKAQVVCIEKPVTFDALERAIAEVLARMDRPESSSSPAQPVAPASTGDSARKDGSAPAWPEATNLEQELINLENAWNEALVNGKSQALDALLADICICTLPDGSTLTKAEMQLTLRSSESAVVSAKTDDIKVWVYSNTAIVIARCTVKESVRGEVVTRSYRFTHTWVREGRTWRCVASHDSKLEAVRACLG